MSMKILTQALRLLTPNREEFNSYLGLYSAELDELQLEVHKYLSPREIVEYQKFANNTRAHSYLLGRRCGKELLAKYFAKDRDAVTICNGAFGQPFIPYNDINYSLSLSHCENIAAGLLFPLNHPMGIDIEKIDADKNVTLLEYLTKNELNLINNSSQNTNIPLIIWSARESLAKILTCGIAVPKEILAVKKLELSEDTFCATFCNFFQIKA